MADATVRDALDAAVAALAAAGLDTPRADAEWLLADLLGGGRLDTYLALDRPLEPAVAERYRAAVRRRRAREPVQQILGWEEFRGLRLRVTPDVLIPRPETEVLTGWALELLPPAAADRWPLAVDVGTGSGCIACAIAHERPDTRVLAIDVSPRAAAVARANAVRLGVADRVRVVVGDLLGPVGPGGPVLIVANPPYLPTGLVPDLPPEVGEHEPHVAIDGGPDGLTLIRPLVGDARARLVPGGALALETTGAAQAWEVAALMGDAGFVDLAVRPDLAGVERLVAGRLPAPGRPPGAGARAAPARAGVR